MHLGHKKKLDFSMSHKYKVKGLTTKNGIKKILNEPFLFNIPCKKKLRSL